MDNKYQVRVNGIAITSIRVQNELIDGVPCGKQQIAFEDPALGWMTLDDNPPFVLEVRDSTIPPAERRGLPHRGWEQTSVAGLLSRLGATGVLK